MSNIKLKPIKPGMVIHCPTEEEAEELFKCLNELGYKWDSGMALESGRTNYTHHDIWKDGTCYGIYEHGRITFGNINAFCGSKWKVVEFSDLIEPGLTPEETLRILSEATEFYCKNSKCSKCPFGYVNNGTGVYLCGIASFSGNEQKIIEICRQWKADHEKKEPEVEWVDICRIIEVLPDNRKRCVYEEEIKPELSYCGDEKEKVEEVLKRYRKEHDGNFFAVHEVVCREKAVN